MTEKFEDVTVLGHPMLFTCLRVDRDTVPQGMYMYEVRHDDDQQMKPEYEYKGRAGSDCQLDHGESLGNVDFQ